MAEQLTSSSDSGPESFDEIVVNTSIGKETDAGGESGGGVAESTGAMESGSGCSHGVRGAEGPVETGIDRLLERHRSEIMYELRRLKMGDRPVTGQENRKNVEDFFLRSVNPEAATSSQEDHRPEAVVVEVRGLVESRPVSSVLQSARFRRNLENALRGSLSAVQTARHPPVPPTGRPTNFVSAGSTSPPGASTVGAPAHSDGDGQLRTESLSSVASFHTLPSGSSDDGIRTTQSQAPTESFNRRSQGQENDSPGGAAVTPAVSPGGAAVTPADAHLPPIQPAERAQAWLRHQPDNLDPSDQRQLSVWDTLEQTHRESIIDDISDLVHRQLVTTTRRGHFRQTLEVMMRDRIESSGLDGRRVEQVIRQLPRMPAHMRNDFSDIGLPGQQQAGNHDNLSDNISVISATAAVTIPTTHSTAMMGREITSLKSEVAELKNMMRLSFDLQLDIQRSIRQEVAAAIASALSGAGSSPTLSEASGGRSTRPVDDTHCLICLDAAADAVLYQCGHLCVCYTCGLNLRHQGANCPVCRAPIRDIIRAYKSGSLQ